MYSHSSFISLFFFSIWPHPLRKDKAKTQRCQAGTFGGWFLAPDPSHPAQALKGHPSLPPPITTSLFSQQGIAFPVLTLALAHNTRFSLPPPLRCFLLCIGARLLALNHTDLGSDIYLATSRLRGFLHSSCFICQMTTPLPASEDCEDGRERAQLWPNLTRAFSLVPWHMTVEHYSVVQKEETTAYISLTLHTVGALQIPRTLSGVDRSGSKSAVTHILSSM